MGNCRQTWQSTEDFWPHIICTSHQEIVTKSDTHHDLSLLYLVASPVTVTPDEILRYLAIRNGWLAL